MPRKRRFYSKRAMAKERLSRLQKWILREAWKRLNSQHPKLRMDEIYIGFFKVPKKITTWENIGTDGKPIPCSWERYVWPNSKKVILCNSLRRLCEKGLIKIEKTDYHDCQKTRAVALTKTGEQKALILTPSTKNANRVNNKTGCR